MYIIIFQVNAYICIPYVGTGKVKIINCLNLRMCILGILILIDKCIHTYIYLQP